MRLVIVRKFLKSDGSRLGFFRSGDTNLDFIIEGNSPRLKEMFAMLVIITDSSALEHFKTDIGMMSSGDIFDGAVSIRRSTSDGVTGAKDDRIDGKALCGQFVIVPLNARNPASILAFTCFTLSTKNVEIPFARTEVSRPSNHGVSDVLRFSKATVDYRLHL